MRKLIQLLLLGTVAIAATGCVVVPADEYYGHGGGYHHGGGYYDYDHDRRDHCR